MGLGKNWKRGNDGLKRRNMPYEFLYLTQALFSGGWERKERARDWDSWISILFFVLNMISFKWDKVQPCMLSTWGYPLTESCMVHRKQQTTVKERDFQDPCHTDDCHDWVGGDHPKRRIDKILHQLMVCV